MRSSASARIYHHPSIRAFFYEQIAWIINHARKTASSSSTLPSTPLHGGAGRQAAPSVERYIILTDAAHMSRRPNCANAVPYEDWLRRGRRRFPLVDVRRTLRPPASATPRARQAIRRSVLYSHRSNVLHSMASTGGDGLLVLNRRTRCCRSCRCSTPIRGRSLSPARCAARKW